MKRKAIIIILAVLFFLLALGITAYPIISSQYNEKHQSQIHTQYIEQVEQVENAAITKARESAISYNESIIPGPQAEDSFSHDAIMRVSEGYEEFLNLTGNGIMGYIEIPEIEVYLPIYHGTDESTLEIGVGHLIGSSLPVGGESTHAILSAHSGVASQRLFTDLPDLEKGDVFYLHILNETLVYQVYNTQKVLPYDTSLLGISQGKDLCTLVTCVPIGINTHRLLVMGERIDYEPTEKILKETAITEEEGPSVSAQNLDYLKGILYAVRIIAIVTIVAVVTRRIRRGKR